MFPSNPQTIFDLHNKKEDSYYLDLLVHKAMQIYQAKNTQGQKDNAFAELREIKYQPYSYAVLAILYYLLHDGIKYDYWPEHTNEIKKLFQENHGKTQLKFQYAPNYLHYVLTQFKNHLESIDPEIAKKLTKYFEPLILAHSPGLVKKIEIKSNDAELPALFNGILLSFDDEMIASIESKFQSDAERSAVKQVKNFLETNRQNPLVNSLTPFIKATTAQTEHDMSGVLQRIVTQHLLSYVGSNQVMDPKTINLLQPSRNITIYPFRNEMIIMETFEYSKLQCPSQQILPISTTDQDGREIQQQENNQPFLRAVLGYTLNFLAPGQAECQIRQLYTESYHPAFRKIFLLDNMTGLNGEDEIHTLETKKQTKKKQRTIALTDDMPIFYQIIFFRNLITQLEQKNTDYKDYLEFILGCSDIAKWIFLTQANRIIPNKDKRMLLKNYLSRRAVLPNPNQWISVSNTSLDIMLEKLKGNLLPNASKGFVKTPFNKILSVKDMLSSTIKTQLDKSAIILRSVLPPEITKREKRDLEIKKIKIDALLEDIQFHFSEIDSLLINPNNESLEKIAQTRTDEIKNINKICLDRNLDEETCRKIYSDQYLVAQSIWVLATLQKAYYKLQLYAWDITQAIAALKESDTYSLKNNQQLSLYEQGQLLSEIKSILDSDLSLFCQKRKKTTKDGDKRSRRPSKTAQALPPQTKNGWTPSMGCSETFSASQTTHGASSTPQPEHSHRKSTP